MTLKEASERMSDGMILNNTIVRESDGWDLYSGNYVDEEGELKEIIQFYIISESDANYLADHSDQIIYYNEKLDLYLWCITTGGNWENTEIEWVE